ncbi:hypothetical protein SD436_10170 [Streptococcus sp. 2A/TPW/M5]
MGNHTWDHPQLPKLSLDNAKRDLGYPRSYSKSDRCADQDYPSSVWSYQ